MRRPMNANRAPPAAGEEDAYFNGNFSSEGAGRDREQDKEEKTAEVNGDEEFFASGHFAVDDATWDGLETAYNLHLQLAPSVQNISCPICLRVTQFPVRQDCGHVLCWYCMQQSFSAMGDCPLCQAQQIFKTGKNDFSAAPETEVRSMGFSYASAVQDLHLPISSSGMVSGPYQGAIVQVDQMHYTTTTSNPITTAVSAGCDTNRHHHDLLSNSSDIPLQLDNLSDLDDVIDLDDLVSSDSERPSPPIAAKTSLSGNFVPEPVRNPRVSFRKMSSGSFWPAVSTRDAPKVVSKSARPTGTQAGKRKARPRKIKREELAVAHMGWEMVSAEGTSPEQRYDCGLAIYGSLLIVVGGIVGKLRLNDLHTLDLAAKPSPHWAKPVISGTPPQSGNLLQIFVIGDDLYAIGGTIDGKFLTELHRINLKSEEWKWEKVEVAGTPPSMRYWYSLTVLRGMAILYGGYGHPQRLSDTFALRFDTEVPTWVELRPRGDTPGPSSTHSVCVVKDRMYIFGGYDGKYRRGHLFAFEIESVSNERIDCAWRKVETQGQAPASRYTHSAATIGSQLIVYGGNTGCLKGDVYVLDLGAGEDVPNWTLVKCDPPLIPRAWHRAVVYNDAMYVFGGHTARGNDDQVTRLILSAAVP